MFILLVYTVKICHNICHFIIARSKVGQKRKKKKKAPSSGISLKVFFFFSPLEHRSQESGEVCPIDPTMTFKSCVRSQTEKVRVFGPKAVSVWTLCAQVCRVPEPGTGNGLC